MGNNLSSPDPFPDSLSTHPISPEDIRLDITLVVLWVIAFYGMAMIFSTCRLIDRWKGPLGKKRTGPGKIVVAVILSTMWPAVMAYLLMSSDEGGHPNIVKLFRAQQRIHSVLGDLSSVFMQLQRVQFFSRRRVSRLRDPPIQSSVVCRYNLAAATRRHITYHQSRLRSSLVTRPLVQQPVTRSQGKRTMAGAAAVPVPSLPEALSPGLLQSVYDLWFEHLDHEDAFILPGNQHDTKWFREGKQLDAPCVQQFKPTLEAIRSIHPKSSQEIIAVVNPTKPQHWLTLILLLDQVPRNVYRNEPEVAFSFFDPLALGVAHAAIARGYPECDPWTRWQFSHRRWFLLPIMHSEDAQLHRESMKHYEALERDVETLLTLGPGQAENEWQAKAAKVAQADAEAARSHVKSSVGFMTTHYQILERFGRYPHRNKALGRVPTQEETDYLEGGGETFGG